MVLMVSAPIFLVLGLGYLLGWAIRRGWSDAAHADARLAPQGSLLKRAMSVRAPWWVIAALALALVTLVLPVVLMFPAR
jgi:hypothetical protein